MSCLGAAYWPVSLKLAGKPSYPTRSLSPTSSTGWLLRQIATSTFGADHSLASALSSRSRPPLNAPTTVDNCSLSLAISPRRLALLCVCLCCRYNNSPVSRLQAMWIRLVYTVGRRCHRRQELRRVGPHHSKGADQECAVLVHRHGQRRWSRRAVSAHSAAAASTLCRGCF